jgi:cytochrome oxidase Cu insertion factor (SCO1/SenC/PrrC family)
MRRLVLLGAALCAALVALLPAPASAQRSGKDHFPNLPVVTQDGKELRFYDDLIKGRIVVISFIFTRCTDMCPITSARLAQIQDKLGDPVGKDIFFLSISVDPLHDTPEQLKKYADAFQAGPGWQFVTGRLEDIRAINRKLGERMVSLSDHRNEIVLGNDATGEWQRDNAMGDIERVVMTIRAMDPKWRNQERAVPHNPASNTGYEMSHEPGQALFKRVCAACHTIGVGDRVGPDLRGVVSKRDRTWLTSYIRNPATLRRSKDPVALALAAKYPVRMPAIGISDVDAKDLIAYLETQSAKLASTDDASTAGQQGHKHHHHHHH